MIVAEIMCAVDAAGTQNTFYVSEGHFITSPTDTPPNTAFLATIVEPGSIGLHVFGDGKTSGSSSLETGEMILTNADGMYDNWINYSFDGRKIVIRRGDAGAAYPASFTTIFTGTIEGIEATWERIIIRLRDKQFVFSTPLLKTKYTGGNLLPDGLEGNATDIKDSVKPRVYGQVFNITPRFVNTAKLTYQVSDGAVNNISAVYDRGLALTVGADFATSALLQSAAPAASSFITCKAEGLFRLGSTPAGQITADVTQGATAADRTVAQIVKAIALASGITAGEVSATDVTAMDAANNSVVGIYIDDEASYQDCMDELLNSVGGYCGFDSLGVLRLGILLAPSGTPVVTLREYDIHKGIERRQPTNNGIPTYRVVINHTKIYTTQPSDLAGAVTTSRRAYLSKDYRSAKAEDLTIKNQWLLASEYSQDTLLTTEAAAIDEASRQLTLYKVRRDIYDVPVQSDLFINNQLKFMDVISLEIPRFSMQAGKIFRLIGFRYEMASNQVIMQLWG